MRRLLSILLGGTIGFVVACSAIGSYQWLRLPPTLILGEPPATLIYDTLYEERLKSGKEHSLFAGAWSGFVETLDEPVAITRWEEGVSTWEVFFGTNRAPAMEMLGGGAQFGRFGNNELDKPFYGRAFVTLPKRGQTTLPLRLPGEPPVPMRIEQSLPLSDQKAWSAGLADQVNRSRQKDLLLFVHGFNVDFENALATAAGLALNMPFNGGVVAYSWPSQGGVANYETDEPINSRSVEPFTQFLQQLLAGLPEGTRVNIVVHSMGNRLVMQGIGKLPLPQGKKPIEQLVLCAPDVGVRDFRAWAPACVARCEQVTLYATSGDTALIMSKGVHFQEQRAGDAHPPVVLPGLTTIDCSALTLDFLGHSYYANDRDVLADLFRLLKERRGCETCPHLTRQPVAGGLHYWYFSDHAQRVSVVWNFEEGAIR